MNRFLYCLAPVGALLLNVCLSAQDRWEQWSTDATVQAQHDLEEHLLALPSPDRLRAFHDLVCAEPHPAGSAAHERLMAALVRTYEDMNVDVERHDFWAYLGEPSVATVEILPSSEGDDPIVLSLCEDAVDQWTERDDAPNGYNAYSGSGDVTASVVYANYGTRADFEKLKELGVDCNGKVVIARYGRNYRGYKAKFAEEAGAAALLIYTDPKDSGYTRGPMYPDGGFANGSSIQRGSIKTLPYAGDPLTPTREATEDARRLNPDDVALPRIPVQPLGWTAASKILERMNGRPLPEDLHNRWKGGLELPYNLTSDDSLGVRVNVQQNREVRNSANILATFPGSLYPDDVIIIGCHSDAWTFGSGDPHAGTIILLELAHVLAQAREHGFAPKRTIIIAHWGAEEFGIIGSTEWVEANQARLRKSGVAYINMDMAAMGMNFRSSSAPLLKSIIADVTRDVPHPSSEENASIYDTWVGENEAPRFGNMGGGSDHLPFNCFACMPCCTLGAGGAAGVSYHSNYDNLDWYRKVVGDDYESARMLTQVAAFLVTRLANADLIPLDPERYAPDLRLHIRGLERIADAKGMDAPFRKLHDDVDQMSLVAVKVVDYIDAVTNDGLNLDASIKINSTLRMLDRNWAAINGLPERSWYRSMYAATDPDSGYAAWMLPALRLAIENDDNAALSAAIDALGRSINRITRQLENVGSPSANR